MVTWLSRLRGLFSSPRPGAVPKGGLWVASPPCRLRGHSPAKAQRNPGPPGKHPRGPSPCVYRPHHVALGHTPCSLGSWKHTGKELCARPFGNLHSSRDPGFTVIQRLAVDWGSESRARVARPSQPSGLTTKGGPSCSSPGTCPPEVKNPEGEGTPQPKRRNPERKGTPWPKRRKTSGAPLRLSDARGEKMQSKPFATPTAQPRVFTQHRLLLSRVPRSPPLRAGPQQSLLQTHHLDPHLLSPGAAGLPSSPPAAGCHHGAPPAASRVLVERPRPRLRRPH
ncbi:basic salivary proline-rich protein 4-like [Canis lupus familiaris]|uniref:basic salivary proline-rich protein 4-like n=1 Tax=Canis lupus familiaris TaxID=9615 RepID=UPI000BAA2DC8|nr:basic salivary proline-rich protein 4-like [Canis lupus familiaris]XP_035576421.1 basic salivary proline-rich protein 4-like [Canis lupus dingo]XP_038405412.1 basic salivary proline-rich protein 4-like [Canis lupus familiaris]XP_038531196.1 basic salivary proline-rich protein 4-like [Canis lupus familiaris]|eukprot:XP_022279602.1 basic salivary proline-rich protein 4-like [Canis lupus familiaris]